VFRRKRVVIEDILPGTALEGSNIEFKRQLDEGKSLESGRAVENNWLKTFVAFANTSGGVMYVGVDDRTHQIISLDSGEVEKTFQRVRRLVREKIEPKIEYCFEEIPVDGGSGRRYLIKITVEHSRVLPVTLHSDGLIGIYVRNFSSSELATSDEIRDLVLMSDSNPFDSAFTGTSFDEADYKELYSIYSEKNDTELTRKALISMGFINSEDRVSRGGELFRDGYDGEKTKLVCTLWPELGKGSSVVLASVTCSGNLFECIRTAVDFVRNHSANGYRKQADGRTDYFSYPARSVLEGVVNAVAHRNYFITGSQIEVNIFRDRLEITSPGALLGVSRLQREKNLSSIIPRRRNEVICRVLESTKYMESKGSGFDKIERDYSGKGESFRPYISSDGISFTLTLPDLTCSGVIDEDSCPAVYVRDGILDERDLKILSYCYMRSHSAGEIARYIDIKASSYFRKEILGSLVSKGYLIEDHSKRAVGYSTNQNRVSVI
jgi:ATP-dependent DNA helicase RecG